MNIRDTLARKFNKKNKWNFKFFLHTQPPPAARGCYWTTMDSNVVDRRCRCNNSRDSSRVRIVSSVSWCHGMYRKSVPIFPIFPCLLLESHSLLYSSSYLSSSLVRWRQRINCTIIIIIRGGVGVPRRKPHLSLASSQLSRIQVRTKLNEFLWTKKKREGKKEGCFFNTIIHKKEHNTKKT